MPAISIIVPVYNVEKYLAECLDSLVNQTFKDIEIICVNDGSKDNSKQILEEYSAKDKRIIVIEQENAGLSAARNTGVRNATGEFICYVDSDDAIELNACEILWEQIQTTQADIIVFGMKDLVKVHLDEWFKKVSSPQSSWYTPFDIKALLYENGAYPYACRNCFRRSMLVRNGLTFDESVRYGEDIVYQFYVFPYAKRIQFIPDKLYLYRRNRVGSLTQKANTDMSVRLVHHINMLQHIYDYWQANGFLDKYGFELNCWMLNFLVPDFRRIDPAKHKEIADMILKLLPNLDEYVWYMCKYDRMLAQKLYQYADLDN